MEQYDILLMERPVSLSAEDLMALAQQASEDVILLDIEAKQAESCAAGFITEKAADVLDYDFDQLKDFVASILDDMELESEDGVYQYKEKGKVFRMLLTRNLPETPRKKILRLEFMDQDTAFVEISVPEGWSEDRIRQILSDRNRELFDQGLYFEDRPKASQLMEAVTRYCPQIQYHMLETDWRWNDAVLPD